MIRKKFKRKEVEEYLKGEEWIKEFSGIKNSREVRRRLRITSEAQDKRDFAMFSGFRLEPIAGTKKTIGALELVAEHEEFFLFGRKTKPERLISTSMIIKK